jgi:hypothetical protein
MRIIGTGIFNSPSTVIRGTGSVGITLLFWLAGALCTVAGTHLNIEFGLSTPRHIYEGVEQGISRSGGTLNYVSSWKILWFDVELDLLKAHSYNMSSPGPRIVPEPSSSSPVSLLRHILYLETWREIVWSLGFEF